MIICLALVLIQKMQSYNACIRHYDHIVIKENRYCTIQYSVMLLNSFLVNVDSNSRRQVGNIPCLFFLLQILRINKKKLTEISQKT